MASDVKRNFLSKGCGALLLLLGEKKLRAPVDDLTLLLNKLIDYI